MSIIRMPANLVLPERSDRRSLLRASAGIGLGLGAASMLGNASAQDHDHSTPDSNGGSYVGSDASTQGTGDATPGPGSEVTPFERYNPYLDPVEPGDKHVTISFEDRVVWLSNSVQYAAWTLNGTVPGPALRAVQGDTIHVRLENNAPMTHSIDFHASRVAPEHGFRNIQPGEVFEWEFVAEYPGAFMVHCGTAPTLVHIAAGMYLPIIIDPAENMFEPATELVISQSDFYTMPGPDEIHVTDGDNLFNPAAAPNIMAFNGHQSQYIDEPIEVPVGELVRIYFVNQGPNIWSAFHVVGGIFSHGYLNANPKNVLEGLQTITVGPGDGVAVELTFDEPGDYIAVNHSFGHAAHGAAAILRAR